MPQGFSNNTNTIYHLNRPFRWYVMHSTLLYYTFTPKLYAMYKKLFILAFILNNLIPKIGHAQNILTDSVINELRKGVEGFKNRFHSPSIVVAIVHDKNIIFSEALGYIDTENKIPATIDSKYPILSITKTFTATMLMQLVERKK
jgi:CubicO group peptidase (beta-lactamase class C family)